MVLKLIIVIIMVSFVVIMVLQFYIKIYSDLPPSRLYNTEDGFFASSKAQLFIKDKPQTSSTRFSPHPPSFHRSRAVNLHVCQAVLWPIFSGS